MREDDGEPGDEFEDRSEEGSELWDDEPLEGEGRPSYPIGPDGLPVAGMQLRLEALATDAALLLACLLVMGRLIGPLLSAVGQVDDSRFYDVLATLAWIGFVLYMPVSWYLVGGTVGQLLIGLRILRVDGSRLGLANVVRRYLAWSICLCCVIPAVLTARLTSLDPTNAPWPDRAGGTVVVRYSL